ncbi:MAG: hypothetical protein NVS2B12_22110 [Ktedonobacteraceae bacterium]
MAMALFPPQVVVPLSECSSQIHVQGQLTQSTVTILANGAEVAGGKATGPDQWFPLKSGARLAPGAKVTAVQELGGERSAPSPDSVIVQARPPHPGYAIFDPSQHLWVGAQCLLLVGMVPGAMVTVQSLEGTFTAQADDGTAVVSRKPLAPHEIMQAHQTACGINGPPNQSVAPEQLPAGLYSARISQPLSACQTQVTVQQVAEGGSVIIERPSETFSVCFPLSEEFVDLGSPLQENEELHLQVQLPGSDGISDAGRYRVGPQPPAPKIAGHLCAGATSILVQGLTRHQKISLLQDGNNVGTFESPGASYAVPVPPLSPGAHFRIQYEFCGVTSTTRQEWVVEPAPATITVPVIPSHSLTECSTRVLVTHVEAGAHVQLFSEQLGGQIGDSYAVSSSTVISVTPALSAGDQVIATQSACGHVTHSSPVQIQALGDLPLPIIQPLPIEGAHAVTVANVVPGAGVDLYVNSSFAGSAIAESTRVLVPIIDGHPELTINQKVNAQQQLCTIIKVGPTVVVQPMPPKIESFQATPQAIDPGQSSILTWRTFGADSVKVNDENGHLVVSGLPDDQKTVRPTQTTTYTLIAVHAGVESRSHPVTVTVRTAPPSPQTTTQTIELFRQTVFEGSIPYIAKYPSIGFLTGTLKQITIPSPEPGITFVSFVKVNRSTQECGNPDAVVSLRPGESTTPNILAEIFGTVSPSFPVTFVACIGVPLGQPVPTSVAITITYTSL